MLQSNQAFRKCCDLRIFLKICFYNLASCKTTAFSKESADGFCKIERASPDSVRLEYDLCVSYLGKKDRHHSSTYFVALATFTAAIHYVFTKEDEFVM